MRGVGDDRGDRHPVTADLFHDVAVHIGRRDDVDEAVIFLRGRSRRTSGEREAQSDAAGNEGECVSCAHVWGFYSSRITVMSFVINSTGRRRRAAKPSSCPITDQRPRTSAGVGSRVRRCAGCGVRGKAGCGAGCGGMRCGVRCGVRGAAEYATRAQHRCHKGTLRRIVRPRGRLSGAQSHHSATFRRTVPPQRDIPARGRPGDTQCRGGTGRQHRPTSKRTRTRKRREHADVAAPVRAHARELSREAAPAPR